MKKWLPMILGFLLLLTGISYSHAASVADQIISTGTSYMGTPYQYGAPAGQTKSFDCSSFTQYIYLVKTEFISPVLPKNSTAQVAG